MNAVNTKRFTLTMGVVLALMGILGFIPGFNQGPFPADPDMALDGSYGRLFGLFPVNILDNIAQIALGVWAIVACKDLLSSIRFCKTAAIVFGGVTILGLIAGLNTFFGLLPVFGHDVWLNAIFAIATGYYGYAERRRQEETIVTRRAA